MKLSPLTALSLIREGKYEEARDYLENTFIPETEGNFSVCTSAKHLLADVLLQLNLASEATKIIEIEVAPALEKLLGGIGRVIAHQKLAHILTVNRQFAEAQRMLVEVEPIVEQSDNIWFKVKFKEQIAKLLEFTGENLQALEVAQCFILPSYQRLGDVRGTIATKLT